MRNIEDILALCIEDIKSGRTTIEACLAQYPSVRGQLEPLLRLALNIQEPPPIKPSDDFKIRARVRLMDYIHDEQKKKKSWRVPLDLGLIQGWRSGWLKTAAIVLVIVLIFTASGTGTAYASQDSLPGDILYSVKIATENVRKVFTFNDFARIELELAYAGTRLEEMEALVEKNPGEMASAVRRYEENITKAVENAERGRSRGKYSEGLEIVTQAASKHLSIIDSINDIAISTEREALQQAAEIALQIQLRALGVMATEDPVRAMEMNMEIMRNRLNRASDAAYNGKTSEFEKALGQFERMRQFGEEISRIAKRSGHDTTIIDALNTQGVSEQLGIIKGMHGKVPDEIISSLEDATAQQDGGYGKGKEGDFLKETNSDIPVTSDNNSQGAGDSMNLPAGPSEDPGNQPDDAGSPGGSGNPSQNPGSPPDDPGNGNGGSGNGKN